MAWSGRTGEDCAQGSLPRVSLLPQTALVRILFVLLLILIARLAFLHRCWKQQRSYVCSRYRRRCTKCSGWATPWWHERSPVQKSQATNKVRKQWSALCFTSQQHQHEEEKKITGERLLFLSPWIPLVLFLYLGLLVGISFSRSLLKENTHNNNTHNAHIYTHTHHTRTIRPFFSTLFLFRFISL